MDEGEGTDLLTVCKQWRHDLTAMNTSVATDHEVSSNGGNKESENNERLNPAGGTTGGTMSR